jgi:hypothetical protein
MEAVSAVRCRKHLGGKQNRARPRPRLDLCICVTLQADNTLCRNGSRYAFQYALAEQVKLGTAEHLSLD